MLDERSHVGAVFTHLQNFWSPDVDPSERTGGEEALAALPGYSSVTMLARRGMFERIRSTPPSNTATTATGSAARRSRDS